jgi:hypothetical protein
MGDEVAIWQMHAPAKSNGCAVRKPHSKAAPAVPACPGLAPAGQAADTMSDFRPGLRACHQS